MSNNSSELQSQDSMTTIIKVNENIKYTKTSFLLAFVMYISKIAPNLLNWPSELNQLEIVSRISISNLFKRIEYIKSTLDFLLNYSKTTENVNSSITNSTTNIHEHNKATIILGNLSLDDKLVMEHLSELLTKTSDIIWIIIHSTAYWIMTFQSTVSSSCPSNNIIVSDEWLNPLVRFTTSFKNCINELDKKSYHSQNSLGLSESYSSRSSHSHRHSQRCSKDQEKAPSSSKHENRHRKPRTRQLDTDGLMDDILHNLTLNPLRTDIHVRRLDKVD
ncbi:unnamed protein product [Heterobilharzia americana]|nr:unnamed protein product [Heterobilharzia americana]